MSPYLDFAATCPVDRRVLEAMLPWWTCGNPASQHPQGQKSAMAVAGARTKIADVIGADPRGLVFTSGATEADNLAIKGYCEAVYSAHIVTCATEHKAVLRCCEEMAARGATLEVVGVDRRGVVDIAEVERRVRTGTLVSIMAVNNETGVIQPVDEIGYVVRRRGGVFHSDCAQAIGRIEVSCENIDLMSLSAHKCYGPKGVGALWVRPGTPIFPQQLGGRQEHALRAGTTPTPLVVGFSAAVELAARELDRDRDRAFGLRERLLSGLADVAVVHGAPTVPQICSLGFPGHGGEAVVQAVQGDVCCSAGSACGKDGPSHVMAAMGFEHATLRLCIGRGTARTEIDGAVQSIREALVRCCARTA